MQKELLDIGSRRVSHQQDRQVRDTVVGPDSSETQYLDRLGVLQCGVPEVSQCRHLFGQLAHASIKDFNHRDRSASWLGPHKSHLGARGRLGQGKVQVNTGVAGEAQRVLSETLQSRKQALTCCPRNLGQ